MAWFRIALICGLPFSAAFRVFGSPKADATPHAAEVRLSHDETYSLEDSVASILDSFSPCFLGNSGEGFDDDDGLHVVFSKLCELAPPPSCFRNMLAVILPSCEILTTDERVTFSIRLTLCELSAAHVKSPRSCSFDLNDHLNRQSCLKDLEASPQFWTSFSGNFRSIATICLAERKNHEKEEVIRLHQNITAIQAHALHVLRDQLVEIDLEGKSLRDITASWTQVLSDLESKILDLGKNVEKLSAKSTDQLESQTKTMMSLLESSIARAMVLDDISGSTVKRLERVCTIHAFKNKSLTILGFKEILAEVSLSLSNTSKDSSLISEQQFILAERIRLDNMVQGQGLMLDRLHESHRVASEMADVVLNLKDSAENGISSITTQSEAATQRVKDTFEDVESTLQRFMSSVEAAESTFLRLRTSTRLFLSFICVLIFLSKNIVVKYGIVLLIFVYGIRPFQLDMNLRDLVLIPRHVIRTPPHVFIPGVAIVVGIFGLFTYACWWLHSRAQMKARNIRRRRSPSNSLDEIRRNPPEVVPYY
ncbi:hypothetical protein LIPSTDRAFT_1159 [Lipomyces starkeyi NRRL Y-11557]|uniref:Nuclear fusion protein KAR5 n=1 Tax=Lipomyces starkeyi NRRL Y-11557 TaxID=675824 RepID=A0A1E3QFE9_LIPST|nr:hypothetical protein LIPSTDRAFT_1159 [Lipomyces starkeyi NRRL Y-11557]